MKKIIAIALILFTFLLICTGCSSTATDGSRIVTSAKVRYFDGSTETLEIEKFEVSLSGLVVLYLKEGVKMYFGANNVIIIKETEEQYTH